MANILLVDDDPQYRSALQGLLADGGHTVQEAEEGVAAQAILKTHTFDLIISDIRMPKCDGVQLLKWVKEHSQIPVVLITGFSEILEAAQAAQIGANGFLAKPFKFDEIEKLIQDILNNPSKFATEETEADHLYCKVPVESFVTGSNINFNIFHRITNTKYIKIANRGEDIVHSRIDTYKAKGMQFLYLTKADFAKYVTFNIDLVRKIKNSSGFSEEKKRSFVRYTTELIREEVFIESVDKQQFESAMEFTKTVVNLALESDDICGILSSLSEHADYLYAHSLGVSLYSIAIAREMEWHWTPKLFKIALAGLLHDVGLKEVPREIIEKPRAQLTTDERRTFESHAHRGMEMLNKVPGLSEDVILSAYQHHEVNTGEGFPQHLHRLKIHPVARLISTANTFCEFTIARPGQAMLSADIALKHMKIRETTMEADFFAALKRVFKFDEGLKK